YFILYACIATAPFAAIYFVYKRSRRSGQGGQSYRAREIAAAMLFLSPWAIGMIVLIAGPILFSVLLAFTRYDVLAPARYVGGQNFRDLAADPLFYKSTLNTLYMLIRVPLVMAVSLAI